MTQWGCVNFLNNIGDVLRVRSQLLDSRCRHQLVLSSTTYPDLVVQFSPYYTIGKKTKKNDNNILLALVSNAYGTIPPGHFDLLNLDKPNTWSEPVPWKSSPVRMCTISSSDSIMSPSKSSNWFPMKWIVFHLIRLLLSKYIPLICVLTLELIFEWQNKATFAWVLWSLKSNKVLCPLRNCKWSTPGIICEIASKEIIGNQFNIKKN